ncbi:hypothetical protein PoB_006669200 [Plakobranchus ocellatus]|uniref:Uncharacterized protein n=1 Tax=Plakobranchus ocellatus TaxID=259542 RepID=A0AAV4D7G0_9GAST|nr:hypothetical protein PoB_006669200 [Plakobranchus ocellatus]
MRPSHDHGMDAMRQTWLAGQIISETPHDLADWSCQTRNSFGQIYGGIASCYFRPGHPKTSSAFCWCRFVHSLMVF